MKDSRPDRRKTILILEQGFTMIELLMVIFLIGMITAIVVPQFMDQIDDARQKDAQAQIEMLGQALDLYRLEKGKYPAEEEGLKAIAPYLKKELPKDPWGNPYHYKFPGEHGAYDLMSYGEDNAEGGEGNSLDIVSWKNLEKSSDE